MTDEFDNPKDEGWGGGPSGSGFDDLSTGPMGTLPRNPRGPKRRVGGVGRALIVVAFVVCVVVIVGAAIGGMRLIQGRSGVSATTSTTAAVANSSITVKQGMGANQVGQLLVQAGLIESASAFVDLVKARGSENVLKPGTYNFSKGEQLLTLVKALEDGSGATNLKVTIPEGKAADQVAALLTKGGAIDGASYLDLVKQPGKFVVPKVGDSAPKVDTLEGLLFPSTYFLAQGDDATALIGSQLAAFEAKTASLPWSNATALGVTPYQVVIVASMIEKEANIADERAKVAAVIYNRLKKKMTLGFDSTVRYAVGKWTGSLTADDLKVDSPYNTRLHKGLPPGPIASPGTAALMAALEPATADYLYFITIDAAGHHLFTASYDEFLQAKKTAPQE